MRNTAVEDVIGTILAPKTETPYNSPPASKKR
jgi:hypothetical protein